MGMVLVTRKKKMKEMMIALKVIEVKPIVHYSTTAEANQMVVVVVAAAAAAAAAVVVVFVAVENHSVEAESIASSL